MPVSSVTLTVSHLPTSTSFYLAALQPLGYQYIGQWGNQIGLGADGEADFFLTQEVPGLPAGTTHVAFDAPSRAAVHNFFAAALRAGASPHGSPGGRYAGDTCFNAAVLDFDGNSVEVVYHENSSVARGNNSRPAGVSKSKVLEWKDGVSEVDDDLLIDGSGHRSVVSARSTRSSTGRELNSSNIPQVLPQNVLETIQRSISGGVPSSSLLSSNVPSISISPKALAGTLLGAAAGAAVAYAMCKSEEDSARAEEEAAILEAASRLRSGAGESTKASGGSRRGSVRKIEAPPFPDMIPVGTQNYMNVSAAPSTIPLSRREAPVEYVPLIPSNRSSRSQTVISARSARRPAPELMQDSVPMSISRSASAFERVSEPTLPRNSSSSGAKSEAAASRLSKKSSHSSSNRSKSKVSERRKSSLPAISETAQLTSSRHSRTSKKSSHSQHSSSKHSNRRYSEEPLVANSSAEFLGLPNSEDETDTVVPSDSISCVGSSTHRSRKSSSTTSKHHSKSKDGDKKSKASSKHSKQIDRHEDIRSEPPIRKSKRSSESNASEVTITPKNFKERSVTSLPLRGFLPNY